MCMLNRTIQADAQTKPTCSSEIWPTQAHKLWLCSPSVLLSKPIPDLLPPLASTQSSALSWLTEPFRGCPPKKRVISLWCQTRTHTASMCTSPTITLSHALDNNSDSSFILYETSWLQHCCTSGRNMCVCVSLYDVCVRERMQHRYPLAKAGLECLIRFAVETGKVIHKNETEDKLFVEYINYNGCVLLGLLTSSSAEWWVVFWCIKKEK